MDAEFTIGENRARPSYQVKTSRCTSCSAPLSLYSEKSQLIVCEHCGERLDCSQEELVALGKIETRYSRLALSLHQEFVWEGIKYKVIARMLFDDQVCGEKTTSFLLFHPLQGTRWFSVYHGEDEAEYSISTDEHMLALSDPFDAAENNQIATGDQRLWRKDGELELLLLYVDGALPWMAKSGDVTQAIEYIQVGDRKRYLTVEKSSLGSAELEYSYSRYVSHGEYRRAIGKRQPGDVVVDTISELATKLHPWMKIAVLVFAILGVGIFGFLGFQSGKGEEVASFTFTPEHAKLERGIVSPSFTLSKKDIKQPLKMTFQGISFYDPVIVLLKVPSPSTEYTDLLAWDIEEQKLESYDETRLEETFVFYTYPDLDGKSEELFALQDEGEYRLHVRYSKSYQDMITANTSLVINKQIPLTRYYLLMFGCSLWALLVWRKL